MASTRRTQRERAAYLVPLTLALVSACDLLLPPEVPIATLYSIPTLMAAWLGLRRRVVTVAATSTVLTLVLAGAGVSGDMSAFMTWIVVAVSLFAIWVAASFSLDWVNLQRSLKHSQELQVKTLANIAEGVVTIGADDRIRWLNMVAARMTGWSREAAIGQPLDTVLVREADHMLYPEGLPGREIGEVLVAKDGSYTAVEFTRAELPAEREDEGQGAVLLIRDVSEQRVREGAMLQLAYRDPLTGLANRASLGDRLELELDHAKRREKLVALLFLDLDGLKRVNDAYGHDAGDALIKTFGARVKAVVRKGDTVARLAGDEFNVVLPELDAVAGAELVAEKVLQSLAEPLVFGGHEIELRASIGIALFPQHGATPDALQRRADEAMYAAKQAGGQQYVLASNVLPPDSVADSSEGLDAGGVARRA